MNIKKLVVGRGLIETKMIEKSMMDNPQPSFRSILYRTIISHIRVILFVGFILAILLPIIVLLNI